MGNTEHDSHIRTAMAGPNLVTKVFYVLTFIVFILVLIINYLAGAEGPKGPLKFLRNTTGEISNKYYLEITPASWTFSIWGFIYAWQALWLCYSLSFLCRRSSTLVLSLRLCAFFIGSCFCNISWIFLFGVEEIVAACVLLFATVVFLYAAIATVYQRVRVLDEELPKGDYIAVQSLVINGIAFYATWVSIASLLNLAMVLTYKSGMDQENASTLALSLLACEIVAWFISDVVFLKSMTKFTISPWIVLIVALTGSLYKNYVPGKRNSIMTLVLLCVVGVLAVIRLAIFAVAVNRERKSSKEATIMPLA